MVCRNLMNSDPWSCTESSRNWMTKKSSSNMVSLLGRQLHLGRICMKIMHKSILLEKKRIASFLLLTISNTTQQQYHQGGYKAAFSPSLFSDRREKTTFHSCEWRLYTHRETVYGSQAKAIDNASKLPTNFGRCLETRSDNWHGLYLKMRGLLRAVANDNPAHPPNQQTKPVLLTTFPWALLVFPAWETSPYLF